MSSFDVRVAGYAWIQQDSRVLLTHWRGFPELGIAPGWTLPGGGMEYGESVEQTVRREVLEETGHDVVVDRLVGTDTWWRQAEDRADGGDGPALSLRIIHTAHIVGGELRIETDGSSDDVGWFEIDRLSELSRVGLIDAARRLLDR